MGFLTYDNGDGWGKADDGEAIRPTLGDGVGSFLWSFGSGDDFGGGGGGRGSSSKQEFGVRGFRVARRWRWQCSILAMG
jgi:hypothetical protein